MTTTPNPTLGIALQWQYERDQLAARVRELEAALADIRDCMGGDDPAQGWDNPGAVWGVATRALGAASDG